MSAVYGPQIVLMLASALERRAPALEVQAALMEPLHKTHSRLLLASSAATDDPKDQEVLVVRCIKVND